MVDTVVNLRGVTKRFDDVVAVKDANLEIERGELITLLGPSGCGKTTTLRMLAGFETPSQGIIEINDDNVIEMPPYERNIGMVFQHFALFPHMTVADNIAFGLKMAGTNGDEIDDRVQEVLEMVSLPDVGDRYPENLSGGQQQRIALARSLVVEPDVLLLDEPLSSLDKKLRHEMRLEIMRLHGELDVTMIYVTHNQEEALSMSDRMAVMDDGHIHQVGSPTEVYQEPADEFVAGFIGTANLFGGTIDAVDDGYAITTDSEFDISAGPETSIHDDVLTVGNEVTVLLRPERLYLGHEVDGHANQVNGTIREITYLGSIAEYYVTLEDGTDLQLSQPIRGSVDYQSGDEVTVGFDTDAPIVLGGK